MLGWRKLTAWFLVYALAAAATYFRFEIPENNVEMIKWVTGFFFGSNALIHTARAVGLSAGVGVGPKT